MKINVVKETQINIKSVRIFAKSRDNNSITLYNELNEIEFEADECTVPDFIPEGGDYIDLHIDIETGQVLNWPKINPTQIEDFIDQYS